MEVLDTEPSIEDGTRDTFPVMKDGEVEFKDVSFKYPDAEEYVLEHISFSAKKGETIAFYRCNRMWQEYCYQSDSAVL